MFQSSRVRSTLPVTFPPSSCEETFVRNVSVLKNRPIGQKEYQCLFAQNPEIPFR